MCVFDRVRFQVCFEKLWVDCFGLLVNDHVSTPAGLKGCPQSEGGREGGGGKAEIDRGREKGGGEER